MILENLAAGSVHFHIPINALRVTQFDLIDMLAIFLFKPGIGNR
jgi:hypothetical protein